MIHVTTDPELQFSAIQDKQIFTGEISGCLFVSDQQFGKIM